MKILEFRESAIPYSICKICSFCSEDDPLDVSFLSGEDI